MFQYEYEFVKIAGPMFHSCNEIIIVITFGFVCGSEWYLLFTIWIYDS